MAPSRVKMITANFIETSKVYNFWKSVALDFFGFVIKFGTEISTYSSLFEIKILTIYRFVINENHLNNINKFYKYSLISGYFCP